MILQLDQDGLDLWLSALRNATSLHSTSTGVPSLLDLAPAALQLLANNLDLLGTIVSIIEGYFLLDASSLLQVRGFLRSKVISLQIYIFHRLMVQNYINLSYDAWVRPSHPTLRSS